MADDPDTRPREVIIPVSDTPHAPFIFYEGAPAFGFTNGVVNITLAAIAQRLAPTESSTNRSSLHICAGIFKRPSACAKPSTAHFCWRHQRSRVRRINCQAV
jgi:hypothetical protein